MTDLVQAPLALAEIARCIDAAVVIGDGTAAVRGIRHDSRKVESGDLFVARKGEKVDGLAFIDAAIAKGATAILVQRDHAPERCAVPMMMVPDVRIGIARAAAAIYGHPTRDMQVVGITGTNGKTTTSYLVRAALNAVGARAAVLGTLGAHFPGLDWNSGHTTPEADELVRTAAQLRELGASHLVMEVSSHALAQHRADGVEYQVAAYTNLTQDHLDFHGTMQAYAAAKARLFSDLGPKRAAVMIDDSFGVTIAEESTIPTLRVSRFAAVRADIRPVSQARLTSAGTAFEAATPYGKVDIESPLVGEHNVSNLLLALAIGCCLDLPVHEIAAALSQPIVVPGRMERCDSLGDDVVVVVDYAHSPDALERALIALRPLTQGRLYCVFGCGGDRDRGKRPQMGAVAAKLADRVVVTNDNPRSESPQDIIDAILKGITGKSSHVSVQPDRQKAIAMAVTQARAGDVVLLAGKGHEPYQIIGSDTRHFDDREQARLALELRRNKGKES